ncbi:MAG TPA: hypothetical protein VGJ72_13685 [Polaromonas sp.]
MEKVLLMGLTGLKIGALGLYQMTKMAANFVSCVKQGKLTTWVKNGLRTKARIAAPEWAGTKSADTAASVFLQTRSFS